MTPFWWVSVTCSAGLRWLTSGRNNVTGVLENMPVEARLERLQSLADVLLRIVQQAGQIRLADALTEAAATLRTAISQIKQGLNYALSNSMLRLSANDMLTAA